MKALNDAHELEYEKMPEVVAKAPGRFHLAGEHSWFYKDKTISMAINLLVHVGVSKRDDGVVKIYFQCIFYKFLPIIRCTHFRLK